MNKTENAKPDVIDLDADAVEDVTLDDVGDDVGDGAENSGENVAPAAPIAPKKTSLLPVAFAALVVGSVGGSWLYQDYLARYFPSDEMTALIDKVGALQANATNTEQRTTALERLAGQLKTDVDAMEMKLDTTASGTEQNLAAMQALTPRVENLNAAMNTASADLKSLKAALSAASVLPGEKSDPAIFASLSARVDALEQDLAKLKAAKPAVPDGASLVQALADLKARIASGASFQKEYDMISAMVPSAEGLDILQRHAAAGLANAQGLAKEAGALALALPKPAVEAGATEKSYWDSFTELFSDLIVIRNLGDSDWSKIAAKAAALAEANDLAQAIELIDKGEGAVPEALAAWRELAAERLALDAALLKTADAVMRQIAAKG
jgi:hypothetical protein